jgi:hypothetical protein
MAKSNKANGLLKYKLLSVEHSPSWEAKRRSAGQEFSIFCENLRFITVLPVRTTSSRTEPFQSSSHPKSLFPSYAF